MSSVTSPKEIVRERVAARLEALPGMTPYAVSKAIGASAGYVRDLLDPEKSFMPGGAKLHAMAEVLETTTNYLLGEVENSEQPISEVSFLPMHPDWGKQNLAPLHVLGTGLCDDLAISDEGAGEVRIERLLLEQDHTVRMIERPPGLADSRDAYAIYFHGSSMEPRFFQGELGYVDPSRPPSPGDFVVVQLTDGTNDHVITVLVKQLVKVNGNHYVLRQYNPQLEFSIPRGRVARLHRICTNNDLARI